MQTPFDPVPPVPDYGAIHAKIVRDDLRWERRAAAFTTWVANWGWTLLVGPFGALCIYAKWIG